MKQRIKNACLENGNKVEFTFREDDFFITIKSNTISERVKTTQKTTQKSSEKILGIIRNKSEISAQEIASIIAISPRAVEKNIAKLKQKGKLKRVGSDKGGYWEVYSK